MMKTRYAIMMLLLLGLVSCEERNPPLFDDVSGVYFNNMSGTMSVTDSLDITFVYEASDMLNIPVRVQLLGRTSDQDRPLEISVTSPNAREGVDYIVPENPVIPAGESYVDYNLTLLRTEALKSERKSVHLELHANEHFELHITDLAQVSDTVSLAKVDIYFSDMFTKAPSAWDENLVGEFTQQKFELICKVLDIDPADFNDQSVITLAKLLYISAELTAYVREQVDLKASGKEYDQDAFDPDSGEPLIFVRS